MDSSVVKDFLSSCHYAKRIVNALPELPQGITPRNLRVLEAVQHLSAQGGPVRVSDVSAYLEVTRPSITNAIERLAKLGYLQKSADPSDKRGMLVSFTAMGKMGLKVFVTDYHAHVAEILEGFNEDDLIGAAKTIRAVGDVLLNADMEQPAMRAFREQADSAKGSE